MEQREVEPFHVIRVRETKEDLVAEDGDREKKDSAAGNGHGKLAENDGDAVDDDVFVVLVR